MEAQIAKGKATLTIAPRVLKFSRQAFYKWLAKPLSDRRWRDEELIAKIRLIHHNDPEFGYRLIADELHAQGVKISERRVWRLYSSAEIFSVISRRKPRRKKPVGRSTMICLPGTSTPIPQILRG